MDNIGDAEMKELRFEVSIERCDWAILEVCGLLFLKGLCKILFSLSSLSWGPSEESEAGQKKAKHFIQAIRQQGSILTQLPPLVQRAGAHVKRFNLSILFVSSFVSPPLCLSSSWTLGGSVANSKRTQEGIDNGDSIVLVKYFIYLCQM